MYVLHVMSLVSTAHVICVRYFAYVMYAADENECNVRICAVSRTHKVKAGTVTNVLTAKTVVNVKCCERYVINVPNAWDARNLHRNECHVFM